MKRYWKAIILGLAAISAMAVLAWYAAMYFHKTSTLTKVLNAKLPSYGEISDREAYDVYNAIIEADYTRSGTDVVLIMARSGLGLNNVGDLANRGKPVSFELSDDVWNDFIAKNGLPSKFGNSFTLSRPYLLVDVDEMADLNLELWDANITYSPFLELSQVGFNDLKDQAYVHVGEALLSRSKSPTMFADGFHIWLRKVDGVWKIQKKLLSYIT